MEKVDFLYTARVRDPRWEDGGGGVGEGGGGGGGAGDTGHTHTLVGREEVTLPMVR